MRLPLSLPLCLLLVLPLLNGCMSCCQPPKPIDLPELEPSKRPLAVANRINTGLLIASPLNDENQHYRLRFKSEAGSEPYFQAIERELQQKLKREARFELVRFRPEYSLELQFESGAESRGLKVRLFRNSSGELAWNYDEEL